MIGIWGANVFAQSGDDQNRRFNDVGYWMSNPPKTNPLLEKGVGIGFIAGVASSVAGGSISTSLIVVFVVFVIVKIMTEIIKEKVSSLVG